MSRARLSGNKRCCRAPRSGPAPAVAACLGAKLRDPLAGEFVDDVGRNGGPAAIADHIRTPHPPNSVVSAPAGIRTSSVRLPSRASRVWLSAMTVAFLSRFIVVFSLDLVLICNLL